MNNLIKSLLTFALSIVAVVAVHAETQTTFEVNAPMLTVEGEPFRVEFTLNAKPDEDSFVAPSFEGLSVIAGPSTSQGRSIQFINGSMSQTVTYSITYVVVAEQSGECRIEAAKIAVDGTVYSTHETIVEVRPSSGGSSGGGFEEQQPSRQKQSLEQRASQQVGKDDLLLRINVSRTSVYKGEPLRATLKLYSRVAIAGSEALKIPPFNGFWSQKLESEQGPFRETYGGKVYDAYTIGEYLLYPQQSGALEIAPAEITVYAQVVVSNPRANNFFFGGPEVYNLPRQLRSPKVVIDVRQLPAGAPASFGGAVGRYTMEANLSSSQIAANSAANLSLRIAGAGNINFLQAPTLNLPSSFELYDVKTTEQIRNTASGSTGSRTFEYPFIARAEGNYTIAPVEFTYFNPTEERYVTLRTDSYTIDVTPDPKGGSVAAQVSTMGISKEDVKMLGNDIRFIALGSTALRSYVAPLVLSPLYWVIVAAMVALFLVVYVALRKRIRDNRNSVLVKGRRANKVAVQRFRAAAKYMREGNRHAFYEEMLKALWGYMSDRFNIPVADLTRESIREELLRRGAANEAREVVEIIAMCEEAQYSPVASCSMDESYAKGIEIISKIESIVKK